MENVKYTESEVKEVVDEFYQALQSIFTGDSARMEQVWSHADDVTYLGPQGGLLIGWTDVSKAWKHQASLNLKGSITPQNVHIIEEGSIAIAQNYETGTNIINGKVETVRIRAINVFRKENGKWKMITHQTDLLPSLEV